MRSTARKIGARIILRGDDQTGVAFSTLRHFIVQPGKISNVVRQKDITTCGRPKHLLCIRRPESSGLGGRQGLPSAMAERLCDEGMPVFIEENLSGHELAE